MTVYDKKGKRGLREAPPERKGTRSAILSKKMNSLADQMVQRNIKRRKVC